MAVKHVAKLLLIDDTDHYLLMQRSQHLAFPHDPDLPGGKLDDGETALQGLLREVYEETGLSLDPNHTQELYSGDHYSGNGNVHYLFQVKLTDRPTIQISHEHATYEWLSKQAFLEKASTALDTYMHMVCAVTKKLES